MSASIKELSATRERGLFLSSFAAQCGSSWQSAPLASAIAASMEPAAVLVFLRTSIFRLPFRDLPEPDFRNALDFIFSTAALLCYP